MWCGKGESKVKQKQLFSQSSLEMNLYWGHDGECGWKVAELWRIENGTSAQLQWLTASKIRSSSNEMLRAQYIDYSCIGFWGVEP